MPATTSQDTEITLGTGRMLAIFFALVVLCAVMFATGFSVGKNSVKTQSDDPSTIPVAVKAEKKASAANLPPSSQSPDMTFYKSVGETGANSELSRPSNPGATSDAKSSSQDAAAAAPSNSYYVQVAAVSKQDDAGALVDALKKKQYNAVAAQSSSDKLFHVQVGPFADIKDAEAVRAQLLGDGYNPILKK